MENQQLDYRYADSAGLPFAGTPPLVSSNEYFQRTRTCTIAKSGIFRVNEPDYLQSGRTMQEVLTRHSLGEFSIVYMREYNNGIPDDKSLPPLIFMHLIWYEQFDVLTNKFHSFVQESLANSGTTGDSRPSLSEDNRGPSTAAGLPEPGRDSESGSGSGDVVSGFTSIDTLEPGTSSSQGVTDGRESERRIIRSGKKAQPTA